MRVGGAAEPSEGGGQVCSDRLLTAVAAATFHAVSLPAGVIKACRAQDRWGSGWRGGKYRGDLKEW